MMSEGAESASYQGRLVEIFQSCDSANKGYLSLFEFERLCRQLQLQHQKQRLYKDLGLGRASGNTKVYFEDFKAALLSLLQEVGPETLASGELNPVSTPTGSPILKARRPHGNQKRPSVGDDDLRLDLPADMTDDDISYPPSPNKRQPPRGKSSPTGPLKRAFLEQDHGEHTHAGKQRRSNPTSGHVETFEAEGQLASLEPGEYGLESDSGLEQLHHVCSKLGVGYHGYLTQTELGQVCQYIGMDPMDDEELEVLFHKLDVDHDGYISFDEFVDGLARHTITTHRGFETPTRSPALRPQSGRKVRTPLPPAQHERWSPAVYSSGDSISLFSSLQSSYTGFAKGEEIVDYWERLNVPHGAEILTSLGFDPHSKIHLKELSVALTSEWTGQVAEISSLGHAVTATYQQELVCLRSGMDQVTEERDKLRSDLADALSRNAIMAAEVDERHAQLEKSYESRLQSLKQEYQEQLRHSQAQLEKEREAQNSQSALPRQNSEQLQGLQQQVTSLKERLAQAEKEASSAQIELNQTRDKLNDWETKCNKLKKEMQQHQEKQVQPDSPSGASWEKEKLVALETAERYAAENKELKDDNDELVAQLEELQQRGSTGQRRGSMGASRIPVRSWTTSASSDTSEWDDDDMLSSMDGPNSEEKVPLSIELKQQQRQKIKGERRERERNEIEHGYRVEIAELEDRQEQEKQQLLRGLEREKARMTEEFQSQMTDKLAEQQKELLNAFAMEKQDILQQYESRKNLMQLQHQEELKGLEGKLQEGEKQLRTDAIQEIASNLYGRSRVQEVEKAKGKLEKQLRQTEAHYEAELENLRKNYDSDLAELKASQDNKIETAMKKVFEEGAGGLEGQLREDFQSLVHQHRLEEAHSTDSTIAEKEELIAAFERDKLGLVQHYESQIMSLQEELGNLRHDFEAERASFQQLESGDLAQSIRQELQEEVGGQMDQLRQSLEEERRELAVQNQLLEEELADMKGMLMQERQRSAEVHTLKENVRRLRYENKEVQCLAESMKDKVSRSHQQTDMERANYERRIDELEREKEQALRVQALQYAGSAANDSNQEKEEGLQQEILQQVLQEVEAEAVGSDSPHENIMDQGNLDQLQSQITQLNHQLQEARTAQFEYQQLKDECQLLRQTNSNLEDMVRVLRQHSEKEQIEREKEDQEQVHELWEEKKKLQNLLQRTTDKLLKTSAEMAAGQTQLVREVEHLKQKAGNMVELETFTGLQVSLLETQRHAISLQEALMQRTQLADRIMGEAEKERRQERDAWEEQKREIQSCLDATMEMYRSLALQHKALRQSTTKLATQMKELYVENANLMSVLQQTEAKQIAAQRKNRKLQRQCQAWNDTVHRMLHKKQDALGQTW